MAVIVLLFVSQSVSSAYSTTSQRPCSKTSNSDWTDTSLCGHGSMIAIIVTADDHTLESDLVSHDIKLGLPDCTVANGCLEIAIPFGVSNPNPASSSDLSFYVEQAHVLNPGAKILVVEAKSISWQDKWDAVYYVKSLPEVKKVSSVSYSKILMELGLILK